MECRSHKKLAAKERRDRKDCGKKNMQIMAPVIVRIAPHRVKNTRHGLFLCALCVLLRLEVFPNRGTNGHGVFFNLELVGTKIDE
jgi:hypothetical protein